MKNPKVILGSFDALLKRLAKWMAYLSGALLGLLALFIFADVLSRRFLGVSSGGTDEITGLFAGVIISGAFAYTFYAGDHISIDVFTTRYSVKIRRRFAIFGYLLLAGLSVITSYALWQITIQSLNSVTLSLGIPVAPFQFYVFGAMAVLAVGSIVRAVNVVLNKIDIEEGATE